MNKMIEKFMDGEFVVNCRTEDQARKFVDICYDNGIEWYFSNKTDTNWDYMEKTCYRGDINDLNYGSKDFYKNEEYEIITFEEFMEEYMGMKKEFTKDMLKVGMLVEFKNDVRKVVMPHKDGLYLMGCNSSYELYEFANDLTHKRGDDIMKVYDLPTTNLYSHRSLECGDDNDGIYSREDRDLLWQREEVKELTVDEISELLGYKVKVVGSNK